MGRLLLDVSALGALCAALGMANLWVHDLPVIADPPAPEDTVCGMDALDDHGQAMPVRIGRLPVGEALDLLGNAGVTFVDARSRDAYEAGHVPGAVSLPAETAAGLMEVQSVPVPPNDIVITYCEGAAACEQGEYLGVLLRDQAGCSRVRVLEGGWQAWAAEGAPIQVGEGGRSGG